MIQQTTEITELLCADPPDTNIPKELVFAALNRTMAKSLEEVIFLKCSVKSPVLGLTDAACILMSNSPVPGAGVETSSYREHFRPAAEDGSHTEGHARSLPASAGLARVRCPWNTNASRRLIRDRLLLGKRSTSAFSGLPQYREIRSRFRHPASSDSGNKICSRSKKKSSVREQRISEPGKLESCESKF